MSSSRSALDDLRRQVDEIDDAIHDLLMERATLVGRIADAKGDTRVIVRPDREAIILRRLAARHRGRFPLSALTRIWREIMGAFTVLQGPFAVAVCVPEDEGDLWDVARDHYGSSTPILAVNAPMPALRAVMEGTAAVAVLPWPEDDGPDPWWPALMSEDAKTPRIITRLPFLADGHGDGRVALALAQMPQSPTGDDHTLIGVELSGDISRGRLKEAVEAAGMPPLAFWSTRVGDENGTPLHLVEVGDYVAPGDERLAVLLERLGDAGQRAIPIGGFASPIALGHPAGRN
ncbi:MAG TPA: chorismate mutase [Alphaproteobacteria bacterium]|nr:chorismate mutase [Alphaproteobacteria bacterium]